MSYRIEFTSSAKRSGISATNILLLENETLPRFI